MSQPTLFAEPVISEEFPTLPPVDRDDSQWLRSRAFSKSCAASVIKFASRGAVAKFTTHLQDQLQGQGPNAAKARRKALASLQLLWPCPSHGIAEEVPASLSECLFEPDLTVEERSGRIATILAACPPSRADAEMLLSALWLLLLRTESLEAATCFDLWRWTCEAAEQFWRDRAADEGTFLQAHELSWLVQRVCWEADAVRKLKTVAREISNSLTAAITREGLLRAPFWPQRSEAICQVGRMSLAAQWGDSSCWNSRVVKRLERFLERSAALLCGERTGVETGQPFTAEQLLRSASLLSDEAEKRVRPLIKMSARHRTDSHPPKKEKSFHSPATQSDEAGTAILRPRWTGPVDLCAIRTLGHQMQVDLVIHDAPLLSGSWPVTVQQQGAFLQPSGDWCCTCWFTDKDSQYAEFQLPLGEKLKLIRQFLMPTRDQFLLVADSLRGIKNDRLELQRMIPVVRGWNAEQDAIGREIALVRKEQRVRVFALSAPQFRLERSLESLTLRDNTLQLQLQAGTESAYSAMVLDWSAERRKAGVDWNALTVVEDGRQVTSEEAVAWRWRVGEAQFMLYHSFVPPQIPRTALGLHTSSETVVARVSTSGEFQTLVEVEGAEA